MGKTNLRDQKAAKQAVKKLHDDSASVLVVHYSCESFYDRPRGDSPRITSIAARRLDLAQTHSFSIHKIAELHHADLAVLEANYDQYEKEMLDEFFQFVRANERTKWMHWNMRDANYGFAAIEHRYRVLGGDPIIIPDERKFDLARLLIEIYGPDYSGHPRLESLIDNNKITRLAFLSGAEEAGAFDRGDYVALHQSTLRRVDIFGNILSRHISGSLKTNSNWWTRHGSSLRGGIEGVITHPLGILVFVIGAAIATFIGVLK